MTDIFADQTIDSVALSPDGSTARIYLIQSGPWTGTDTQIASLESKIRNYVEFAVNGQMSRVHPELAGLAWEIVINCRTGPPDPRSGAVLVRVSDVVKLHGGRLAVQISRSATDLPIPG